jgi:hypothetical protein
MKMMLLLFVFFFFFAGVNAPYYNDDLLESFLERLDDLLQKLETIAGNVKPPLPTPLMAAALLFVFCMTLPARLAAAWGCLARWAQSVDSRALAHSRCRWILEGLSIVVVKVDGVLSPFKLEDWQDRARAAETALALARAEAAAAQRQAANALREADIAQKKADVARGSLARVTVIHQQVKAILDND